MKIQGKSQRQRGKRSVLLLMATILVLVVAGCGVAPRAAIPTRTAARPTPEPTVTFTPSPTPSPRPTPAATPTPKPPVYPTPTPTSPPRPPSVCIPAPGVQPVSSAVIFHGNTSTMQVSLTFDSDGGDVSHLIQYLDILQNRGVHATFFLTGDFATAHPDVVRRILNEGHELGNHTVDHPDLANPPRTDAFICGELVQADQMIVAASGHSSRPFFRPPYGSYNDQVRSLAADLGYRTVYWGIDPRDWDPTTTTQDILNRVQSSPNLKPGAIILMHVNSPNEQYALDGVIAGLEQRGYSIAPLGQLLGFR